MSLICGNQAYLYLSVAFIQMLKVWRFQTNTLAATDLRRLLCPSPSFSPPGASELRLLT
jgi:hypothetical protein